jgi:2-amino-4-hydroxy-6-hydroxymethyldihydropteridine diphosphokinase
VPKILLGLGSNVGDRLANLRRAVEALDFLEPIAASRVYETAPMYVTDQPAFYNAALLAQSDLSPLALLRAVKDAEVRVGRSLGQRFGPREIDIDLLAYGSLAYRFSAGGELRLQVPHPRVAERLFVLQPLHDVDPHALLPGIGRVSELIERISDQADTVKVVYDAVLPLHRQR